LWQGEVAELRVDVVPGSEAGLDPDDGHVATVPRGSVGLIVATRRRADRTAPSSAGSSASGTVRLAGEAGHARLRADGPRGNPRVDVHEKREANQTEDGAHQRVLSEKHQSELDTEHDDERRDLCPLPRPENPHAGTALAEDGRLPE
jgi:hypothetical protein